MRSRPSVVHLPWSPLALPNLVAWYDASNAGSITESGGLVSQWNDLSGAGHHLVASGSSRPTTGVDTVNGLNAMKFDGIDDHMACTGFSPRPGARTWLAVIKLSGLTTNQDIIASGPINDVDGDGGMDWNVAATTGVQGLVKENVVGIGSSLTSVGSGAAVQVGAMRVNGGAYYFRLNGVEDGSGTSGVTWSGGLGSVQLLVGQQRFQGWLAGDICELIGCDTTLGSPDLALAEPSLKAKWNTP